MKKSILEIQKKDRVTIIRITEKKLYQNVVASFREEMLALLDSGHSKIIMDLSGVDVMNSSALGVLILVSDRLKQENGVIVVTGLRSLLEELFQRMRLHMLFPVVKTWDEAYSLMGQKRHKKKE